MKEDRPDYNPEDLVNRFAEIGTAQFDALELDEVGRFNRLFEEKQNIVDALRAAFDSDQRLLLRRLYDHPNVQVRLNAAKSTLTVAPAEARTMIERIAASNEFPQAGDAGMCLWTLDEGIFRPD